MDFRKIVCAALAALMAAALFPFAALAEGTGAYEARQLRKLDEVWAVLDAVEAEAVSSGADMSSVTMSVYKAALQNGLVDAGSFNSLTNKSFFFTVDGMACAYDYTARNYSAAEALTEPTVITIPGTKNGPSNNNVLLVGPYYGQDSSFTDQYRNEAQSIAQATGGSYTLLQSTGATGPAIAAACPDAGVVIYDSHGTQSGTSSYLCLTTNSGITSQDYSNGWAVSSGSAAFIDGRYIKNHISSELPNSIFWMAICEGMKRQGQGTTGYALIEAGAGCVYGYSQSVSFTGDYRIEAIFWNKMKNENATVAEAFAYMVANGCSSDGSEPNGNAFPIVMSPDDPFPSNPDSAQTVYCGWQLFGGSIEPVELESWSLSEQTVEVYSTGYAELTFDRVPDNANQYSLIWYSGNEQIAAVSGNNRKVTVTGVGEGNTDIGCYVYDADGTRLLGTASCAVSVLPFPDLNGAANVKNGTLNFINATSAYPWAPVIVDGRGAVKSGNAGSDNTTSTLRAVVDMQAGETLSFDWKASSEANYDKLGFYVNNTQIGSLISGVTDWDTITYTAGSDSTYTFEWRYVKDTSVSSNDDCGYVDNVRYSGDFTVTNPVELESWSLSEQEVTLYCADSVSIEFNRDPLEANQYSLVWYSENPQIASVSGNRFRASVIGTGEGSTVIGCRVYDVNGEQLLGAASCSVRVRPVPGLDEAASSSNCFLSFTNATANYPWEVVKVGDRFAVKSGNEGVKNSTSTLRLVVDMLAGETISFDWKVSSEAKYDKLGFYVNGTQNGSLISGEQDWERITYTASTSRSYTFEWRYVKDQSIDSNDDCGYVDNVEYVSSAEPAVFTVSSGEVLSGGETTVSVLVEGEYTAKALALRVSFDPALLTLTGVTEGEVWNAAAQSGSVTADTSVNGLVQFTAGNMSGLTATGALFTLSFRAESEAAGRAVPVTVEVVEFMGTGTNNSLPFETVNGAITVHYRQGDISMNGSLDVTDALMIMRYAVGLLELTPEQIALADVSGDGAVNTIDALVLLRMVLGLIPMA